MTFKVSVELKRGGTAHFEVEVDEPEREMGPFGVLCLASFPVQTSEGWVRMNHTKGVEMFPARAIQSVHWEPKA